MKRSFCIALTACCLTLLLDRPAQAWSKFNFGVGMNLGWEGAGNNIFWGMLRGGPAPGQEGMGGPGFRGLGNRGYGPGYGPGYDPGYGQYPMMPPMPAPAAAPAPNQAGGYDPGAFGDASPFAMRNGMGYPPGGGMPYTMAGNPGMPPVGMPMPPMIQPMPAPQPMQQMPRADAQPVGYWTYPQYDPGYAYPGFWYGY